MDILRKRQDSRDNGVYILQMKKEAQIESDHGMDVSPKSHVWEIVM